MFISSHHKNKVPILLHCFIITDKEHRLRVIAVNAEGESEPLAGVDSFRTENPYGPPTGNIII